MSTIIEFDSIISCSPSKSEKYPANNLLAPSSGDGVKHDEKSKSRSWKCDRWQAYTWVVLRASSSHRIESLEIVNANSAFIEVFVSDSPDFNFSVLVPVLSCMSPAESREQTNGDRKFRFDSSQLSPFARDRSWRYVKIVCSQPYNKSIKFGIKSLQMNGKEATAEEAKQASIETTSSYGPFKRKTKSSQIDEKYFAQHNLLRYKQQPEELIRSEAKQPSSSSSSSSSSSAKRSYAEDEVEIESGDSQSKTKILPKNVKRMKQESKPTIVDRDKLAPDVSGCSNRRLQNGAGSAKQTTDTDVKQRMTPTTSANSSSSSSSSSSSRAKIEKKISAANTEYIINDSEKMKRNRKPVQQQQRVRKKRKPKPFARLMSHVRFVMSGFENPRRGELRDKAIEIGATYSPNWNANCTHLICAFPNTPKYNEVKRLNGRIVSQKWILDCHAQRRLLPWRNYAMGSYCGADSSSDHSLEDDEVAEEEEEEEEEEQKEEGEVEKMISSEKSMTIIIPGQNDKRPNEATQSGGAAVTTTTTDITNSLYDSDVIYDLDTEDDDDDDDDYD